MAEVYGIISARGAERRDELKTGDICIDYPFNEGDGMAVWNGKERKWVQVTTVPMPNISVHHVKIGDEIVIHGTAFFLTEFSQYHDMPPSATLTSAVELIEIQKET